jgi:predicted DNA-binding transcriptional regulator AlpA
MDTLLTIDQLGEHLATDMPTMLALIRDGGVPAPVTIANRLVRWPASALDAWIDAGCPHQAPMDTCQFKLARILIHREVMDKLHAQTKG